MSSLGGTTNRVVSADDFYEIIAQANAAMGRASEPSGRLDASAKLQRNPDVSESRLGLEHEGGR